MHSPRPRIPQGLLLGFLLGATFLVFSYLRLAGDSQSMLFDHAAYRAVFEGSILGTRLAVVAGWFAAALLLLHFAAGFACWAMARLTMVAFPGGQHSPRTLTALWFILGAIWLLIWNAGHFPHSALGTPYADAVGIDVLGAPLHGWITGLFLLAVAGVAVMAGLRKSRSLTLASIRKFALWSAVPVVGVACAAVWPEGKVAPSPAGKPNIILLGIDSLRYDETQRSNRESHTPHLDAFLENAVRLDNTITPLARTFPSWVSLLTGRHPHSTGAILNLLPQEAMQRGPTLPEILRQNGYHTVYAIDEVRFSNIDESYGFDEMEAPGIGAADFILGAASDTPLLNAVVNGKLGKWLFPYNHANRANAHSYDPQTFVTRVSEDVDYSSPMFMAVHLTLPHWPYGWRNSRSYGHDPEQRAPRYYTEAVRRADRQFGDILGALQERGVLDNAIVIAFSDHGETFGSQHDMLTPPDDGQGSPEPLPAFGHGTTVLAPHQFRVFFSVRGYGPARDLLGKASGEVSFPASLEDVTPTLLELLDIPVTARTDGMSLLPELRSGSATSDRLARRVRFTETEFNPKNIAKMADISVKVSASSLAEAALYYRVDPETDRLEMKPHFLDELRRTRQYAAIGWTQLLGVFPLPHLDSYSILAIDLSGGVPDRISSLSELEGDAELIELWRGLCGRFGDIIDSGVQPVRCATAPPSEVKVAK